MNSRQNNILKVLYKADDFITFDTLAKQESVSVKTVRNDVAEIKEYLSDRKAGYLETKPHYGIKAVISETEWKTLTEDQSNSEERSIMFYIIRQVLKNSDLTASKLAQKYYMSRTQLDQIFEKLAMWFSEKHILLERIRGKGVSIKYSEFNYRMATFEFYREYSDMLATLSTERESSYLTMPISKYTAMCASLDGFDPDTVAKLITEVEDKFGLRFNYNSNICFLYLVCVCTLRYRNGFEVQMPKLQKCIADGESDNELAKALADKIEAEFKIKLPESETNFIAFVISVIEIQSFDSDESRRSFEIMNVELCRLTIKFVNLASEIAGVDLREDKFFVKQLFLQLKPMIARIKYNIVVKNQLLPQIKAKYPNMMAIAWSLGNVLEKELKLGITEQDVGLLALHIGGAIERQLANLTACIICDYGIGISQILKEKILRSIPDLKITSVFSNRDIRQIRNENCDFVISTIPLDDYRINHDIVVVSHLLDDVDIKSLEHYMRKTRAVKKLGVANIAPTNSLFHTDLIFPKCDITDKAKLLNMMCTRLENLGYVHHGFLKSVLERENSTSTEVGKNIALPHGLSQYVNHSAVSVALLTKPIKWFEDDEVDMVFLLAVDLDESAEIKEQIIKFYKSFATFMDDDDKCKQLRNLQKEDEIIKTFEI